MNFYEQQKQIWRFIGKQTNEIKVLVETKHIKAKTWIPYFRNIRDKKTKLEEDETNSNRKSPGDDHITNEFHNIIPRRTAIMLILFKEGDKKDPNTTGE